MSFPLSVGGLSIRDYDALCRLVFELVPHMHRDDQSALVSKILIAGMRAEAVDVDYTD